MKAWASSSSVGRTIFLPTCPQVLEIEIPIAAAGDRRGKSRP